MYDYHNVPRNITFKIYVTCAKCFFKQAWVMVEQVGYYCPSCKAKFVMEDSVQQVKCASA